MKKLIQCRCCGRTFVGYHNSQFCSDCKIERAREASSKTWQKMKIARERKKSELYGRRISEFDISVIDMKLADKMGKSQGSFQLWKLRYPEKYEELLLERGYRVVDGTVYQSDTSKDQNGNMDNV